MISITMEIGTPTIIHWPKPIVMSWFSLMCPARSVLGGVPMMVPKDPIEAA